MRVFRHSIAWLRREDANTAEENTNRGLWWAVGLVVVGILAGIVYFVVGHLGSQAQGSASSMATSMSSQSGLTQLAQQAETGTIQGGTPSIGSGGYKAP